MTTLERADHRATFAVLVLAVSAYSLLQSLVIPALFTIQTDLHTTQNIVPWVVTVVVVVAAVFIPASRRDSTPHLSHAELAIVPGGTITEG